jgi:hypothetical protein
MDSGGDGEEMRKRMGTESKGDEEKMKGGKEERVRQRGEERVREILELNFSLPR